MDEQTREKYEEWKRKRIKKRVIFPGIGLLFGLIVLIFVIGSCGNGSNGIEKRESKLYIEIIPFEFEQAEATPLVYLFNSHPLEMVGAISGNPYMGEMNIVELTHILADHLESHGIPTLVEYRCVDVKLYENNWEFYMSYYAARYFVLDAIEKHPSLAFFIDLHRDGVPHDYATASIAGQSYARILFVIGTNNPQGYAASYAMARKLHHLLEEQRPGISRGIFFSGGTGRDGIYSQDISPMLQLIELGTYTSTIEEVSRTVEVLAEVLAEHILSVTE